MATVLPPMTPLAAIDLISPFFDGGWSVVDPKHVELERMIGGYCNTIYKVTRSSGDGGNIGDDSDPSSVIIRIRGGNIVNDDDCKYTNDFSALMIATYELGRR